MQACTYLLRRSRCPPKPTPRRRPIQEVEVELVQSSQKQTTSRSICWFTADCATKSQNLYYCLYLPSFALHFHLSLTAPFLTSHFFIVLGPEVMPRGPTTQHATEDSAAQSRRLICCSEFGGKRQLTFLKRNRQRKSAYATRINPLRAFATYATTVNLPTTVLEGQCSNYN